MSFVLDKERRKKKIRRKNKELADPLIHLRLLANGILELSG